jgi:hypothetical protein
MQSFPDMAEAHAWTLQRLREMAGRLTEQAYLRASEAGAGAPDPEAQARWMLVFDRMARGLRLTVALEARLARERRSDAAGIAREIEQAAPRARQEAPKQAPRQASAEADPYESDRERDDDGLPPDAPLAQRIDRLKAIIAGATEPEPLRRAAESAPARGLAARLRWAPALPCEQAPPADPPWRGSG